MDSVHKFEQFFTTGLIHLFNIQQYTTFRLKPPVPSTWHHRPSKIILARLTSVFVRNCEDAHNRVAILPEQIRVIVIITMVLPHLRP